MIAPHQNSEVRLVLAGVKPLATIEKSKDVIGYTLAVALSNTGALVRHCTPTDDCPEGECVITLPSNTALISEYYWLLEHGVAELGLKVYHTRLGQLFGYSDQDIKDFINTEIDCNCTKCKGV